MVYKLRSIVVEDIHKYFMSRNMDSIFIESSMTHKALQCLKRIDASGVLKWVNPTSVVAPKKYSSA